MLHLIGVIVFIVVAINRYDFEMLQANNEIRKRSMKISDLTVNDPYGLYCL